jgi:serine protease
MQKLLLIFLVVLLQACTSGSGSDSEVDIGFFGDPQNLYPASWQFGAITDLDISEYQWTFSDDGSVKFGAEVSHVFQVPGIHSITLQYTKANGDIASVRRDIEIGSGTISGTIKGALNNLVDLDTRDPFEPAGSNNDFASAQPLSAEAKLSGVVDFLDQTDVYQVKLSSGQQVRIQVADPDNSGNYAQIRARIFSASDTETPLASAQDMTAVNDGFWSFPIPADGSYFIELTADNPTASENDGEYSNHSHGIYSLSIEATSSNAEFAEGRILVLFKENTAYQAQGLAVTKNLGRIKALTISDAQIYLANQGIRIAQSLVADRAWQTLQVVSMLNQHPDIEVAEPDWKRYSLAVPVITDPDFDDQWHYGDIKLQQAWQALDSNGKAALGSSDVTVAVLDSGIILDHPDLAANIRDGYDFVDDDANATDPGGKDINGSRSSFHGTHVAGTVAAINNSEGGTGVAPGVKIMPVRVLDVDGGFISDIIEGICYAAQLTDSYCNNIPVVPAADVINMSLGSASDSTIEKRINDAAMNKGVIVIAAAGNSSTSNPFYPAAYERVISVSATNRNTELASYSNYGTTIDIAAPGGDSSEDPGVLSTVADDSGAITIPTYGRLQGTSMASPHVAGVAALMKTAMPALTHDVFRTMLQAGELSNDIGAAGRDNSFGYGLLDAEKAVLAALQDSGPRIITSLASLYFGVGQVQKSFAISDGGQSIGNITVSENIPWLSLNKTQGLGTYTATVDVLSLEEGNYQGQILITSDDAGVDDLQLSVELQVGNPDLTSDAGVQYVIIQDESAEAEDGIFPGIAYSRPLISRQGEYRFEIGGLPKGRFYVVTGSDLDFDDVICDAGESCGQYPTLNTREVVEISEDVPSHQLNMVTGYSDLGVNANTTEQVNRKMYRKTTSQTEVPEVLKQVAQ